MTEEHLTVLHQRHAYLAARIAAKRSVGWETTYDEREHQALGAVLAFISGICSPFGKFNDSTGSREVEGVTVT